MYNQYCNKLIYILCMLFFCNCSSTVQMQKAEIKNGPDGKGHLNGDWEIDYPSSFSEEDGGIFFESLSFKEDPSKIQDIKTQLSNFKENGETKFIESIELLIYENALAHDPIEVGSFNVSIRAIKSDKLIDAHGIYTLTQTGPLTRLSLFFMDDEAQNEFKDGLFFELEDHSNSSFTIKNTELKSVFRYKKTLSHIQIQPKKVNEQKTLNYYGLKGKVSSMETYTFNIMEVVQKNYICREMTSMDKLFFDSRGEIFRNEFQNFKWEKEKTIIEYKGNYFGSEGINLTPSNSYPDTIKIIRTDSNESRIFLRQDDTIHSEKTTIKDGYRTQLFFEGEYKNGTTKYSYNNKNHLSSFLVFSTEQDILTSSYFQYLVYDEKENWTKRIVFEDKYYQKPKAIEIRVIHYSDK